jgi:protoporphyrinogen oxidase
MSFLPEKPVILGAGPAGLCAGWNLSLDGIPVKILEKTKETGGLSLTFREDDYLFDLGPHNIHSIYPDIITFLKKILRDDFIQHDIIEINLFFMDRFVSYPLKGIYIFKALPLAIIIPAGLSFLWARIKMFVREPKNDHSFESWIKNRFGQILYGYYFGPYAEKTWKIKASEISNYVAIKRVPLLTLSDYIRSIFKRKPREFHSEDWTQINNYYPRKGVGQIADYLADGIINNSGAIENSVEILSINGKERCVESVTYKQNGEIKTIETDFLFNTIPINDFIGLLNLNVPEEVKKAASGLDYCSESLLYIKTSRSNVFDTPLTYFSDPDIKFNRVYEVGSFSKDCAPAGKSALCVEFTCNIGDEIWSGTAEEMYNYAMSVFEHYKMLDRKEVEGYSMRKITHAYPRFRIGFEERLKSIIDYLSTIENVITLGRQGLFCYANVDDVLHMGFRATEMLSTIRRKGIDYSELFPKYVVF